MRIVSEVEFAIQIRQTLFGIEDIGSVTGPGRSGAIAAVYASHIMGVPFIPFGQKPPVELGRFLIIDTATESGATMRKAQRKYCKYTPLCVSVYQEPPRVAFWYEAQKPQRMKQKRDMGAEEIKLIRMFDPIEPPDFELYCWGVVHRYTLTKEEYQELFKEQLEVL